MKTARRTLGSAVAGIAAAAAIAGSTQALAGSGSRSVVDDTLYRAYLRRNGFIVQERQVDGDVSAPLRALSREQNCTVNDHSYRDYLQRNGFALPCRADKLAQAQPTPDGTQTSRAPTCGKREVLHDL